jgi:hypothetical protein
MSASSTSSHPEDGVLLALNDGEPGSDLDAAWSHVERCDACRSRLAAIAKDSDYVSGALASIEVPRVSPDDFRRGLADAQRSSARSGAGPRWSPTGWQVAAALIVLAGAAAASPIRQWFAHRNLQRTVTAVDSVSQPAIVPTRQAGSTGATVSFAPADTSFTVRFDSVPESGTLTVRRSSDANINARIVSGAGSGGDALVVLPGELRVRNAASARASYAITLPDGVTRLRVIVGGRGAFDGVPPVELRLHP